MVRELWSFLRADNALGGPRKKFVLTEVAIVLWSRRPLCPSSRQRHVLGLLRAYVPISGKIRPIERQADRGNRCALTRIGRARGRVKGASAPKVVALPNGSRLRSEFQAATTAARGAQIVSIAARWPTLLDMLSRVSTLRPAFGLKQSYLERRPFSCAGHKNEA
jgi:hypothetical protein